MIKLIVSDVDGTLVPDGTRDVNPELFETILKLREKGIQFAVASGRPWSSVEATFEPIKKKIFYIANNGGYLGCCGRSLYVHSMDRQVVRRLIEAVRRRPDLDVNYAGPDCDYMDSSNEALYQWMTEGYKIKVKRVKDLLELTEPCVKLSIFKSSGVEEAARDIYDEFKDVVQMSCAGDMWMDSMAPGVNKGMAVKTIQDSLGVLTEETMAFGDQLNDLEMLGQAYYSFAVSNAREEIRRAARFHADSNVNDGVLKILKNLL